MPNRITRVILISLVIGSLAISLFTCSTFGTRTVGAVTFHNSVPSVCNETRGLRQHVVKPVHSEQELRDHYGLTFLIHFRDGVSPPLYGTLYYQNREANRYCMAFSDGSFAVFSDSRVGEFNNIMQEVCHPIQECMYQEGVP